MLRWTCLIALFAVACSSNPPPKAEEPKTDATSEPANDPAPKGDDSAGDQKPPDDSKKAKTPDTVPDDYMMTPHDCLELSKKYGEVQRGDQVAALSPKLSQKQKDTAYANIEKAIAPIEEKWLAMCENSLKGNVVDPASIKCAMLAKTTAAFKTCIEGESAPAPSGKKK